jgi:hypothetical protein
MENKKIDTQNMSIAQSDGEPADNSVTRLPDGEGAAQGCKVKDQKAPAVSTSTYSARKGE